MDLNFSSRRSLLEPDKRQKNVNNLFRTQKRRKIMSHMSFIIGFVIFMTNGLLVFVLLQCWLATHQQMNAFENIHFFRFEAIIASPFQIMIQDGYFRQYEACGEIFGTCFR